MTITLHNRKEKDSEFMGRGSVLGNPFYMKTEKERNEVCEKFSNWFAVRVNNKHPYVMAELERLIGIWLDKGQLKLQCFCAPKRCHTETIREYLVWELNNRGFTVDE